MALTPPTYMELASFRNEDVAAADQTYVTGILQQATDALWATTGMSDYPTDQRAQRITKNAILDLTLWLMSQNDHRDEINSPYSSERLGSYSYQKMQSAVRGEQTGIYWLDFLFHMLRNPIDGICDSWATSENVFNPFEQTYAEQEMQYRIESMRNDVFGF